MTVKLQAGMPQRGKHTKIVAKGFDPDFFLQCANIFRGGIKSARSRQVL
jgi:hypothetical protein